MLTYLKFSNELRLLNATVNEYKHARVTIIVSFSTCLFCFLLIVVTSNPSEFQEKQARIAALYIPFLTTILEHALRFHKSFDRPFIDDSLLSTRQHVASPNGGRASPAPSRNSAVSGTNLHSMSNDAGNKHIAFVPFDDDEKRELLLCMVFILKKLSPGKCSFHCTHRVESKSMLV